MSGTTPDTPPPGALQHRPAPSQPVPDPSLFPPAPPPYATWKRPSAGSAAAGIQWCESHLLSTARKHPSPAATPLSLLPPDGFEGAITPVSRNVFRLEVRDAPHHTMVAYPPLFAALNPPQPPPPDNDDDDDNDNANANANGPPPETPMYFEVSISHEGTSSSPVGIALGFVALPYPMFRLPGWHRGSLAVHGADGNRFVNDYQHGIAFADPFARGCTYGIGITDIQARGQERVILTKDGDVVGSWKLREEMDSQAGEGIWGLEGVHDMFAAVGAFGDLNCDVVLDKQLWLYRGMS